jgi:hypothetical protein
MNGEREANGVGGFSAGLAAGANGTHLACRGASPCLRGGDLHVL